jgi:hypothetical protein
VGRQRVFAAEHVGRIRISLSALISEN